MYYVRAEIVSDNANRSEYSGMIYPTAYSQCHSIGVYWHREDIDEEDERKSDKCKAHCRLNMRDAQRREDLKMWRDQPGGSSATSGSVYIGHNANDVAIGNGLSSRVDLELIRARHTARLDSRTSQPRRLISPTSLRAPAQPPVARSPPVSSHFLAMCSTPMAPLLPSALDT